VISDVSAASGVDPVTGRARTSLGRGLNFVGIAVVAVYLGLQAPGHAPFVVILGGIAVAAWIVGSLVPQRAVRIGCLVLMVVIGALTMEATDALMIAPVIAGVVALEADPRLRARVGIAGAALAAVIDLVTAAVAAAPVGYLLGTLGGIALALLGGYSRRQARAAERQQQVLAAERLAAEQEQERAALLADRARAARDVHDVLAHSLGGLVLQLDAVEALFEAGRIEDAAGRAGDARRLAAEGLVEARRAVAALRETGIDGTDGPDDPRDRSGTPATGSGTLAELVDAHRSFGGLIATEGDLELVDRQLDGLASPGRAAVVASVRETLSNSRKHAPGAPVTLAVEELDGSVVVTVSNPITVSGHGLLGIRERFAELGEGSSVEITAPPDVFTVSMRVPGVARAAGGRA
jgi:signal transduction histidine kinase